MTDPNNKIHISGSVQGKTVNIGGVQNNSGIQINASGNASVKTGDIRQTINNIPSNTQDQQLNLMLLQLKEALAQVPEEKKTDIEKVSKRTEQLLEQAKSDEQDPEALESKGELLKKAAENIKDVMPSVLAIATQIIGHVIRLGAG